MYNVIQNQIKFLVCAFVFLISSFGLLDRVEASKLVNKQISYFNGALIVVVNGQTQSDSGVFTADIKDASGNPYTAMTAEWVAASVQMVTMDMGTTKALVSDEGPARVKIQTTFSMLGQWKLNIKLTTAAGSESHSININVP